MNNSVENMNDKFVEEKIFNVYSPGAEFYCEDLEPWMTAIGTEIATVHMIQLQCNFEFMNTKMYPTFVAVTAFEMDRVAVKKWIYTGMCEVGKERAKFFALPVDEIIDGLSDVTESANELSVEQHANLNASIRILRLFRNYQLSARLRLG